jgi:hypothetical protein
MARVAERASAEREMALRNAEKRKQAHISLCIVGLQTFTHANLVSIANLNVKNAGAATTE